MPSPPKFETPNTHNTGNILPPPPPPPPYSMYPAPHNGSRGNKSRQTDYQMPPYYDYSYMYGIQFHQQQLQAQTHNHQGIFFSLFVYIFFFQTHSKKCV